MQKILITGQIYQQVFHKPFRTLVGLIDDYFDGYFSQEMTESQVQYQFRKTAIC